MPDLQRHRTNKEEMKLDDLSTTQIRTLIDEWIKSERDREILKRRLLDGICYEPLAEEFDLSTRQVKNIVYKCEKILLRHMPV